MRERTATSLAIAPVRRAATLALGAVLAIVPSSSRAEDARWTWHEDQTEIYSPAFSRAGNEIALVRKRHVPDGREAEELSEADRAAVKETIDHDERYADPEVVIVDLASRAPKRVGWGWDPAFSPDAKRVAYAHQRKPISRLRVLAATLAGNPIRVLDRASGKDQTVAEPKTGFASEPLFTPDGHAVVFSLGDAVNGEYGGNVGIARAALDGGPLEPLFPPTKTQGLFELIDRKRFVGGKLFAIRRVPLTPGTYTADTYRDELIEVGPPVAVVHAWKPREAWAPSSAAFTSTKEGSVAVFDGGWRPTDAAGSNPGRFQDHGDLGTPSPDGRFAARTTEHAVRVDDLEAKKVRKTLDVSGQVQALVWSPGSDRLAIVETVTGPDGVRFQYDRLSVVDVGTP